MAKWDEEFAKMVTDSAKEQAKPASSDSPHKASSVFSAPVGTVPRPSLLSDVKVGKIRQAPKYAAGLLAENEYIRNTTRSILETTKASAAPQKPAYLFQDPDPSTPLDVLKAQMESEKDIGKHLELTEKYNQKMLSHYSQLFAKTQMEGQNHSILEEFQELANMKGGKEKKTRKEALVAKMEEMGMPKDYYAYFADDGSFDLGTFGKFLGSSATAGLAGFEKSLFDTADLILGAPLKAVGWENNPISQLADHFGDIYGANAYDRSLRAKQLGGGGWDFAGSAIEGTIGALPTAALAMMTGGASLGATTTDLMTQAAYRGGTILSQAGMTVETMMKDPQFWISYFRTYGSEYKEAREKGASDTEAAFGALISSLVNSGIEIGFDGASGIQGLPKELAKGDLSTKEKILEWVKSSLDEGGEEMLQSFVSDLVATDLYYARNDDYDNSGAFDLGGYVQEGALGAFSGAVLGAGQVAVNAVLNPDTPQFTRNEQAEQEGGRLQESYNEAARKGEYFTADLDGMSEAQRKVYRNAMDSKVLNNTNRAHELVDLAAKIAADKGIDFDFTNNEKIQATGFGVEGRTVNGFVSDKGITVNVNSAKALNTVVGHEITHVLEGTAVYTELQNAVLDYAESKGTFNSLLDRMDRTYRTVYEDLDTTQYVDRIYNEMTSELIGDILFTDSDFVSQLSSQNRNVFQRIYDEVKYLGKTATAGSKEARQLLEVQKKFEEAYRGDGSSTAETQYSLSIKHSDGSVDTIADARNLTPEQAVDYLRQAKSGELQGKTYIPVRKDTPQVLIDTLEQVGEKIENNSLVMQVGKAQQAMKTPHQRSSQHGNNVRGHALSADEIVDIVNSLDNPTAVIYQTNRSDSRGNPLPNNVAAVVEYNSGGSERVAVIEFDSSFSPDTVQSDFGDTNFHTVVTVFEPDIERNGFDFDYVEELLSNPDNIELEIKRGQPTESATRGKHPNTSNELPSTSTLPQSPSPVKNSLTAEDDIAPLPEGWTIRGEDVAADSSLDADLKKMQELGETDFQDAAASFASAMEEDIPGKADEDMGPVEKAAANDTEQAQANTNQAPDPTESIQQETPADRAQKTFREKMVRDIVKDSNVDTVDPEIRRRLQAVDKATEAAQTFFSKGIVGVKSLPEIFNRFIEDASLSDFESYLRHLLNIDRCTLDERFGTENKPVFGPEITADTSQKRVAELEAQHPEFAKAAEDVYTYTRYLRDMMVRDGKISQELSDHLQELYPHYIPISRTRNGYQLAYVNLLDYIQNGQMNIDSIDSSRVFLDDLDTASGIHPITSYGYDFDSVENSLIDLTFRTHWGAALNSDLFDEPGPKTDTGKHGSVTQSGDDLGPIGPQTSGRAAPAAETETEKSFSFGQEEDPFVSLDGEGVAPGVLKEMQNDPSPFQKFIRKVGRLVFDDGLVFEDIDNKAGLGQKLSALWQATRSCYSKGEYLIGNGDKSKGVRSLVDLKAEVEKAGKSAEFSEYIANLRNIDGMSLKARYGMAQDHRYLKNVSYGDSLSIVKEMEANNPQFKVWADDLFTYSGHLIDMMADSGTLSEGNAQLLRELYPHYVPVRYTEDGKLQSAFDSLGALTLEVTRANALNEFSTELSKALKSYSAADDVDIEKFINRLDRGWNLFDFDENGMPEDYHTYTVYDGDRKLTYRINDDMYAALKPSSDFLNARIPGLSDASTWRRNLITAYNPWFALSNAVKDFQDVVLHSQHPLETYTSMPKAIYEQATKGTFYQEYVQNGGEYCTYFDKQSNSFDVNKGVRGYLENKTALKYVLAANDFIESIPRLSEYIASREKGRSVAEAMLDSAQVTVNFSAGGRASKFLDRNGCTFLNASIQGVVQMGRDMQQAKMNGLKGWLGFTARCMVAGIPEVMAAALLHKDDEDYDELPDYVKDNFYLPFKYGDGSYVRIPKGRTAAVIQKAIVNAAKATKGNDDVDWESFFTFCLENLAPNNPITDNVFAPIAQVAANTSWFGEDIVPSRLQDLPAKEQYDEKTDALSIWLGEKLDYSPKKIHYLLDQYSGVVGDTLLPFGTPKAESPYDNPLLKAIAPLRDRFTTDSVLNNRVTGDFYETLEQAETAAEAEEATMEDRLLSSVLIGYNVEISKLLRQQREIQGSGLLDSQKYKQNRELKKQINDLEKEALEAAKSLSIDGVYAEAGGKRYHLDRDEQTGKDRWFEIKAKKKDGTDNWYYQQEQAITRDLEITPAEYWNNHQMYDDFYYIASGYDKDSTADDTIETARSVFGYKRFAEYASVLKTLRADKDENGEPIKGTKLKKVQAYVDGLDIPDIEKKILMKMQYPKNNRDSYEIVKWLDENDSISSEAFLRILTELGYKIDSSGNVTWW